MTLSKSIPQNRYSLGTARPRNDISMPRHLAHAAAAGLRAQSELLETFAYQSREVAAMARRNAAHKRRQATALEAMLTADDVAKARLDEALAAKNALQNGRASR